MRTARRLREVLLSAAKCILNGLDSFGVHILDRVVGVRVPSATTGPGWVRWKLDRLLVFGINRLVKWRDRLNRSSGQPRKRSVLVDQAWLDHACSRATIAATQNVLDELAKDRYWGMMIDPRELIQKGYDRHDEIRRRRDALVRADPSTLKDNGVLVR